MAGVLTYAQETALSRRVREWEEKIKPKLVREVMKLTYVVGSTDNGSSDTGASSSI